MAIDERVRKMCMGMARRSYTFYLVVRWFYRTVKFMYTRGNVWVRRLFAGSVVDHYNAVIIVEPRHIQFYSPRCSCKYTDAGKVEGGAWDLGASRIDEHCKYASLEALVTGKASWQETDFYEGLKKRLDAGEIGQGIRTKVDLEERGEAILALYSSIREQGVKLQSELQVGKHPLIENDDIAVDIGRNGELFLVDGAHRLILSQIADIKSVPVRVCVRHKKWCELKEEVSAFAKYSKGGVYQAMAHPDLQDVEFVHGDERYGMIRAFLPHPPGRVLDIGSNWGLFCHKLEEDGFKCVAVENDPEHLYFLNRFKAVHDKKFEVVDRSIFDYSNSEAFDVVLAMNIFHHFLKFKDTHEALAQWLRTVKTKSMIFQPHIPKHFDGMNYFRNYTNAEFVEFVMTHVGLQKSKFIGSAADGRPIYFLT